MSEEATPIGDKACREMAEWLADSYARGRKDWGDVVQEVSDSVEDEEERKRILSLVKALAADG